MSVPELSPSSRMRIARRLVSLMNISSDSVLEVSVSALTIVVLKRTVLRVREEETTSYSR